MITGIELIALVVFSVSIVYVRNPKVAGVLANMSSLAMTGGLIGYYIHKEKD